MGRYGCRCELDVVVWICGERDSARFSEYLAAVVGGGGFGEITGYIIAQALEKTIIRVLCFINS